MGIFEIYPYEFIQRISKRRVGKDFVLVNESFISDMNLVSSTGTIFSGSYDLSENKKILENQFLFDKRKSQLKKKYSPYKKIKDLHFTRQLLEFNKPYILFQDMYVYEQYAVKNKEEALLITERLSNSSSCEEKVMESEELNIENFFDGKSGTYSIYSPYGKKLDISKKLYPNEEELLEEYKIKCRKQISDDTYFAFLKNKEAFIQSITIDDLPICNLPNNDIWILRHESMELKRIDTFFDSKDHYKITIYSYPIKEYTLEDLQQNKKRIKRINPNLPHTLLTLSGLD